MSKKRIPIFPKEQKVLTEFGERIRLARLRRHISTEAMAKRASCSRMTLHRGSAGIHVKNRRNRLKSLSQLGFYHSSVSFFLPLQQGLSRTHQDWAP